MLRKALLLTTALVSLAAVAQASQTYDPIGSPIADGRGSGGSTPGGSTGQFQYNTGTALGGVGGTANTLAGYLSSNTPSTIAVPSCSSTGNVLQWTSGTGFSCVTPSSTIALGTSASATNPQRSSQAGTGIYSDTTNVVEIGANSNPVLNLTGVSTAVDYLTLTNAATANPAGLNIAATGTDSNVNIRLTPKGTGGVAIGTTAASYLLDVNGVARTASGLVSPKMYPATDSTTALNFNKADGTTNIMSIDTSNGQVTIDGAHTPSFYNFYINSPSGSYASLAIARNDNTQAAFIGMNPSGTNTSSNVAWSFGMLPNSNTFNIQAYNGSTTTPYIAVANNGNVSVPVGTLTLGAASSVLGVLNLAGNSSGTVTVEPAAAAGTWTMTLPTSGGTNGYVLSTNGSGVTSWIAAGGTVTLGTSASATNPQRSSQAGTGFYSDTSNVIDVAINSVKQGFFDTTGLTLNTILSATSYPSFKQTIASSSGQGLPAGPIVGSVAIGPGALQSSNAEGSNIAIGPYALQAMAGIDGYYFNGTTFGNGEHNIAIGEYAMGGATASGCTANGGFASYVVAIGFNAGYNVACTTNTVDNTFIGDTNGYTVTTGNGNTGLGGDNNGPTTGSFNLSLGYGTSGGGGSSGHLTTGSRNVLIGPQVASTTLASGSDNILIGVDNSTDTAAAGTSNTLQIKGTGTAVISATGTNATPTTTLNGNILLPGVTTGTNTDFVCMSSGNKLTLQTTSCTISSRRFKENIATLDGSALEELLELNPVQFNKKVDGEHFSKDRNFGQTELGFIAEDVAGLDPRITVYEEDLKTPKSYRTEGILALAVKAIQEQQKEITHMNAVNDNPCNAFNWLGRKLLCN